MKQGQFEAIGDALKLLREFWESGRAHGDIQPQHVRFDEEDGDHLASHRANCHSIAVPVDEPSFL